MYKTHFHYIIWVCVFLFSVVAIKNDNNTDELNTHEDKKKWTLFMS